MCFPAVPYEGAPGGRFPSVSGGGRDASIRETERVGERARVYRLVLGGDCDIRQGDAMSCSPRDVVMAGSLSR